MGRELEGLEMTSERSKDGKSTTITMRVNPVNNVRFMGEKASRLSDKHFGQLVADRIKFIENAYSGKTAEGVQMSVKVIVDPKATLKWDYRNGVSNTTMHGDGYTKKIGNTQNNTSEVNVTAIFGRNVDIPVDGNGDIDTDNSKVKYAANTGGHEIGHEVGLQHEDESTNPSEIKELNSNIGDQDMTKRNLMRSTANGNVIGPNQRSIMLNNIESQQK